MRECQNRSTTEEFHITAFSSSSDGQLVIFVGVLLIYLLAVFGNMTITALVCLVSQLHTPMYFFLCNLSIVDILYVSATLPKLLSITLTGNNKISFTGCVTQQYFFLFCAVTEVFILTFMAYDRYVAICIPLHYSLIMNNSFCVILTASFWITGALNSLSHALLTSRLSFCYSHEINHFFCDLKTLIMLSSSDTTSRIIMVFVEDIFVGVLPFFLTLTSYVYIVSAILKIRSSEGRLKAFSSCTSHLTTVILFYGACLFLYMKLDSEHSHEQEKFISMLYVGVVPMLNPFVYSLRNKEVLQAIKKINILRNMYNNQ